MEDIQQPITEHLADLRRCLIISLVGAGIGFAGCYNYIEVLGFWFFKPLFDVLPENTSLIFTSYQEAFFIYLKLALVCGLVLGSPVILWQIWKFVAPGLYQHEKKVIVPFILLSVLCFIAGTVFAYRFVFPPAFRFLVGYATEYLSPMPSADEYFSLAIRFFIAFGLIFELPIAMVLFAKIGLVNVTFLNKNRKYAVVIAFVAAAFLTPTPDLVNQLFMAIPLLALYEVSIVAVWLFGRKKFVGHQEARQTAE